jgi:hypothetical protein
MSTPQIRLVGSGYVATVASGRQAAVLIHRALKGGMPSIDRIANFCKTFNTALVTTWDLY